MSVPYRSPQGSEMDEDRYEPDGGPGCVGDPNPHLPDIHFMNTWTIGVLMVLALLALAAFAVFTAVV